ELDGDADRIDDAPRVLEVGRPALPRPVEVDDVDEPGALIGPALRGVDGVCVVDRLLCVVALKQADGVAVSNINGGVENHAGTEAQIPEKFSSRRRPAVLDFSGWNWQPKRGGRATAHVKRSPYSALPSTTSGSAGRGENVCTK